MRFLLLLVTACFVASYADAQLIGGGFKPGYYYDSKGIKVEGFINQKPSSLSRSNKASNAILFKSSKDSKKELVYAVDMQSYVVDADSFAVVTLPASIHDTRYRIGFAKVLFDEKTKVYLIEEKASPSFGLSAGNRGAMPSVNFSNYRTKVYLFGENGNTVELMDKKNFHEVLSSVLSAYPELRDKVNSNEVKFEDIERLSEEYLSRKAAKSR